MALDWLLETFNFSKKFINFSNFPKQFANFSVEVDDQKTLLIRHCVSYNFDENMGDLF